MFNEDIDDLLNDESPEISNDDGGALVTSNLGLEIVSTLRYADSGVGELRNSPEKSSKANIMTKDDPATISEDINTDTVESNLVQGIRQQERLVNTSEDLQEETFPWKIPTEISLSIKNTIETIENVARIRNGNDKSRKLGSRSETRPLEPSAARDSPSKVEESITENIEILEKETKSSETNKSSKDTNEWSKSLAGPETSSAAETVGVDLNQELDKLEWV